MNLKGCSYPISQGNNRSIRQIFIPMPAIKAPIPSLMCRIPRSIAFRHPLSQLLGRPSSSLTFPPLPNTISCETHSYLILYPCPHPKLSRYGTAIEESLEASSRSVLPALQAGGRCSYSQEMAGAVDVETRGAIEAGERGGGCSGG